jgi:hypothetical protein
MKKLAVLLGGWHYPYGLYETLSKQHIPDGWEIDLFCIGHRLPEDEETINEKTSVRNYEGNDKLRLLDKILYRKPLTSKHLSDWGWNFILEDNTMGNYEFFNQWIKHYNYEDYDMVFLAHDDNFILNENLFYDVLEEKIDLVYFQGPLRSRDLTPVLVKNDLEWHLLTNSYMGSRSPRGSFGFYTKTLIDKIGGNFDMSGIELKRVNLKNTPESHTDLNEWNQTDKNFMKSLYDCELAEDMRYLSSKYRVSEYCIEGERGYVHKGNASYREYKIGIENIKDIIEGILNEKI